MKMNVKVLHRMLCFELAVYKTTSHEQLNKHALV